MAHMSWQVRDRAREDSLWLFADFCYEHTRGYIHMKEMSLFAERCRYRITRPVHRAKAYLALEQDLFEFGDSRANVGPTGLSGATAAAYVALQVYDWAVYHDMLMPQGNDHTPTIPKDKRSRKDILNRIFELHVGGVDPYELAIATEHHVFPELFSNKHIPAIVSYYSDLQDKNLSTQGALWVNDVLEAAYGVPEEENIPDSYSIPYCLAAIYANMRGIISTPKLKELLKKNGEGCLEKTEAVFEMHRSLGHLDPVSAKNAAKMAVWLLEHPEVAEAMTDETFVGTCFTLLETGMTPRQAIKTAEAVLQKN